MRVQDKAAAGADGAALAGTAAGPRAAVPGGGTGAADADVGGVPKEAKACAERRGAAPAEAALAAKSAATADAACLGRDPR